MDLASASAGELIGFGAMLLGAGAVSGVLAGLFGIGGGAILVPVLYEVFGAFSVDEAVRTHLAVGTSIAVIVPTSFRSYFGHRARGAVDTDLLRAWLVAVPFGVVLAILVAASVGGSWLRLVFAVIALAFAVRFLAGARIRPVAADLPHGLVLRAVGAGIGFVSTLMGIGGGAINNVFMTLFGRPLLQAVATSAGLGVLISVPALAGYVIAGWGRDGLPPGSLGFVSVIALALIVPATVFLAPLGVRIAHGLRRRYLEIAFGLLLLAVSVRFTLSVIG